VIHHICGCQMLATWVSIVPYRPGMVTEQCFPHPAHTQQNPPLVALSLHITAPGGFAQLAVPTYEQTCPLYSDTSCLCSVAHPALFCRTSCSCPASQVSSTVEFARIWWDKHSKHPSMTQVSLWRPVPPPGYVILGDCMVTGMYCPPNNALVLRDTDPSELVDGRPPLLARPMSCLVVR
jgi:hypothetical protein